MAFHRFLSAKPLKKKQEATGTPQVNEAKVLFAQGDTHVAAIRTSNGTPTPIQILSEILLNVIHGHF